MKKLFVLIVVIFSFSLLFGAEKKMTVEKILDHVDKLYRSKTSHAEVEMIIKTPHWKRNMKMEMWTEGMKKTFIVILAPRKDKGVATLRKDREMWNYFPKINKVMKIPPSMMMGSWMGSDFTNDDLVKETTRREDHTFKLLKKNDKDHYYIELEPKKSAASVWGKIVSKIRKSDLLPVKEEYYDEKGKLMRVMTFDDIKEMGGKKFPTKMTVNPLSKKGHSTTVIYKSAKFDIKLKKGTFTLRNLQKKRR